MKDLRFSLHSSIKSLALVAALMAAFSAEASDLKKPEAPSVNPSGAAHKMQSFTLAAGGHLEAAIVGYSLQSRVITMKLPNGQTSYVAPRDLTAMSKLKWLASPAFFDAAKQLRLPEDWLMSVVKNVWGPVLGVMIAGFFCFWGGVSLISGVRTMPRAAKTYGKMLGLGFLVILAAVLAQYALALALKDVAILPMIRSAILVGGFLLALLTAYGQIGNDYVLSGGPQFGVVMATGGIAFTLATVLLYLVPRFLNRPGLDDWFTDSLLAPLGLA